jgi:hypothetical protein
MPWIQVLNIFLNRTALKKGDDEQDWNCKAFDGGFQLTDDALIPPYHPNYDVD